MNSKIAMNRTLVWSCWMAAACCATAETETLSDFRPAGFASQYGAVSRIRFHSEPVELDAGSLAHHSHGAMKQLRFAEPVWVIGYKTEIVDARGESQGENFLCHTFFGDQKVDQRQDREMKGIYSDAFTTELRLPDGFGLYYIPDDDLQWMPMFNNRGEQSVRVAMKVELTLVRAKDLKKPLRQIYSTLRSVQVPHLFFVEPGRDERQVTFEMPIDGTIHVLGTHVHPHALSIELYNLSRKETVWKGTRSSDATGNNMSVYSSAEGYPVRAGETYKVVSVYENPTTAPIDAMAGLFIFYSRE
jgi:hypothetical protein